MPTFREVLGTDSPNTGRTKWNLTDDEVVTSVNTLIANATEVYRGATAPATPHTYKLWIDTSFSPAREKEWNGTTWTLTDQGPAGRGFLPRGAWVSGTTYAVDDIVIDSGETFRRKVTGAGTTAPASDSTNWELWAAKGATGGTHGAGHISTGTDPVPNAVAGGASGLLSGADKTKLDSVEAGATADMTAAEILTATKTVDGAGSGLDADLHATHPITDIQLRDEKNVVSGYPGLDSNARILPVRLGSGTADATTYLAGDQTYKTLPAAGYTPPWIRTGSGVVYGAWADGNPEVARRVLYQGFNTTQNNIGTANARIVSFVLPKQLSLSVLRTWTTLAGTGQLFMAIYRDSDGARMVYTPSGLDLAIDTWVEVTGITGVTLAANTVYWACLATAGSGTTAKFRTSASAPLGGSFYGTDGAKVGGKSAGIAVEAQIPVTSGAFPSTMPTIAAISYTIGGSPIHFLEGVAS